jgi:hypothetical protein
MRTMTGKDLGLGSGMPTSGKWGSFGGQTALEWILVGICVKQSLVLIPSYGI